MNILIIGTGNMARGISTRLLAGGHEVKLYNPDRADAEELEGRTVVDISNPLNDSYDGLVTEGGASAAENIREMLPTGAKVVKAFNTTFAGTLVDGSVSGQTLDVLIAGDDDPAKRTVGTLVEDGGLNAIDVGGLERARQLEALGLLGITLQPRLDTGFMTAWKLELPDSESVTAAEERLQAAGYAVERAGDNGILTRDPWGTPLRDRTR